MTEEGREGRGGGQEEGGCSSRREGGRWRLERGGGPPTRTSEEGRWLETERCKSGGREWMQE